MAALDAQRVLEIASPAALAALSDAALADLETRCKVERERRASAVPTSGVKRKEPPVEDTSVVEPPVEPPVDDTSVVELLTIRERIEFAQKHGFFFAEEIQDTVNEEELDCCGVPKRFAMAPPPGFTTYRRQKPGIVFFPSDRDAVFVVSLGVFGSVPV